MKPTNFMPSDIVRAKSGGVRMWQKTGQVQYLIAVAKCFYVFQPFAGWQEVLRGREFADHCRESFAAD